MSLAKAGGVLGKPLVEGEIADTSRGGFLRGFTSAHGSICWLWRVPLRRGDQGQIDLALKSGSTPGASSSECNIALLSYRGDNMATANVFWVVWNGRGGSLDIPAYRHDSETSAENEARRLAAMYLGTTFHVLRPVSSSAVRREVTTHYYGDAQRNSTVPAEQKAECNIALPVSCDPNCPTCIDEQAYPGKDRTPEDVPLPF